MIWLFVFIGFMMVLLMVFLLQDFARFTLRRAKALKKDEGYMTDAGGYLFVQGKRTYYTMPNGTRRKIADYPMDLTPGSADMNMFTQTMDQARKETANEARVLRKEAKANMEAVAKGE